jgi:hypothetical protein
VVAGLQQQACRSMQEASGQQAPARNSTTPAGLRSTCTWAWGQPRTTHKHLRARG